MEEFTDTGIDTNSRVSTGPSNPIPYPSSHHQNPHRLRQSLSLPDPNSSPFGIIVYSSTPDSNTKSDPSFSSSLSSNLATRLPNRTEKIHLTFSRSMSLPLTMADSGFSPSQRECRRKENRDF
ncbi:hypothetical protein PS2_027490 [Malus domestica]